MADLQYSVLRSAGVQPPEGLDVDVFGEGITAAAGSSLLILFAIFRG